MISLRNKKNYFKLSSIPLLSGALYTILGSKENESIILRLNSKGIQNNEHKMPFSLDSYVLYSYSN